jgi:hypothetical protein
MAHGVLPALAGAKLTAVFEETPTTAESTRPWSSVTVTRTMTVPEAGATTVAVEVSAPAMAGGLVVGSCTVQA